MSTEVYFMDRRTVAELIKDCYDEMYTGPERYKRKADVDWASYQQVAVEQLCKYILTCPYLSQDVSVYYSMIGSYKHKMYEGLHRSMTESSQQMFLAAIEVISEIQEIFYAME